MRSQAHQDRDFSVAFLETEQRRFQKVDVYSIAAQLREEMVSGQMIENPRGLLVHRCREAVRMPAAGGTPEATS
jgi:hypothetical protein